MYTLIEGRHGQFLANPRDQYIGRSLIAYGEYSEGEVQLFRQVLGKGDLVVEVGANCGALTVPLARLVADGRVIAFEPQRHLFQLLCANLALNGIQNVWADPRALGVAAGQIRVPDLCPTVETNFGGLPLGDWRTGDLVDLIRLDDWRPGLRPKLIKIDVEGMEGDVIAGSQATIAAARPILYVENDRKDKAEALIGQIRALGYRLWWHRPYLFSRANHKGNPKNIWDRTIVSMNMLCVPDTQPTDISLPEIV